jgi:hypothetical protein
MEGISMTQIKFKKSQAGTFYRLLVNVKAKGRKTRAVAKFNKLIGIKLDELVEDEKNLIAQYYQVGDDGNPLKNDDGKEIKLENANIDEYHNDWQELHDEDVVIDLTEYQPYLEFLISALLDWDQDLNGVDAIIYDELLDLLESIETEDAE